MMSKELPKMYQTKINKPINSIQKGDKLKVFTETLPSKIASGITVDARIIFVEN